MLKQIIMACVAGLLAACQTSGGTTVGAEWAPNTRAASNVSVVGDDSFITAREWKRRAAGTQERLKFSGGELFYEELYGGRTVWALRDDKEEMRDIFKGFNKSGNYTSNAIAQRDFKDFRLTYLTATSSTQKCFLGDAMSESPRGGWHFLLVKCVALRDTSSGSFENDSFDLIGRLRFDGGALNKSRVEVPVR